MTDSQAAEFLNHILDLEQRSVLHALRGVQPRLSWDDASTSSAVGKMVDDVNQHVQWLTEMVLVLRSQPTPATYDIHVADLHFLSLASILPRIQDWSSMLVNECDKAIGRLADHQDALVLLGRIRENHRAHIQSIDAQQTTDDAVEA
jgi:hypothetical protein